VTCMRRAYTSVHTNELHTGSNACTRYLLTLRVRSLVPALQLCRCGEAGVEAVSDYIYHSNAATPTAGEDAFRVLSIPHCVRAVSLDAVHHYMYIDNVNQFNAELMQCLQRD
jgi:hypothetical protein